MAAGRLVVPGWTPAVNVNGVPIPNAQMFFYLNGTTTLATVYADEALTIPLSNPLFANSAGQWAAVWADDANLFSVAIDAPYGPPGVPFTFDDLGPSTSSNAGALNKLDRDGANAEPGVVENIGAAKITGDTFTGDVGAPRAILRGLTYGGGDTAVLQSTILGGTEGFGAAVFNPASEAEWLALAGTYPTREAVADYKEVGIRDGVGAYSDPLKAWNVEHPVTGYTSDGFTTSTPVPLAILPGSYIQTLHATWWAGKVLSVSENRLSVTVQWGWVQQGQTTESTPTGTTGVILNVVTRSWVSNHNLMGELGSKVQSGVVAEYGVLNRRGNFIEGFNGQTGINDFSGIDVVSFANFVGNYGFRARSLKNGFLVEGTTGDGSGSGFRIKNTYSGATSFNPGYGLDIQQNDRTPIVVRPERAGMPGVYNITFQVGVTGNVDLGSQLDPNTGGRLRFHSAGLGLTTPDAVIYSTGGSATPNTGQANYMAGSHVFTGSLGRPALLIGADPGEGNYIRVDSAVGAPARLSAQGFTTDAGLIIAPKGGGSTYLVDGVGNNRVEASNLGLGFFNVAPVLRQNVTGSTAGNVALQNLLNALTNLGLITNSTT